MKRTASFLIPVMLAWLSAGCSVSEPEKPVSPETPDTQEEILIQRSFLAQSEDTRTTLDGVSVLFAKDESISIWDGSGNREFKADEAGSSVSFSGEVSATATAFYALSPYSASTVFSTSGNSVTARLSLPSTQEATPGSFADGMNISAAQSDSEDSFSMENVLSVAKFTIASANLDGHQLESVELTGSHPLAGDVVVTYGEVPSASAGTNTVRTVTLSHADGSALSDGTYYLTVLPNAGGTISLKFTATDGYTAVKTATLKSAFEAGSIKNLGTVKGLTWEAPKYVKVTAAPADWTGDYLLVYEAAPYVLTGVNNNNLGTTGQVEINDDSISWVDFKAYNIAIEANGNDMYSLYLNGAGYLGAKDGNNLMSASSVSSDAYRWTLSIDTNGNVQIKNASFTERRIYCNPTSTRFCAYKTSSLGDFVKEVQIYKKISGTDSGTPGPSVALTTLPATDVTEAAAILNASYSGLNPINVQEVGFYWGTEASNLTRMAYDNSSFITSSGSISAAVTSLSASTTYYYQVTMMVWDESARSYVEFTGEVMSFTTSGTIPLTNWKGWLELPANTLTADNYIYDEQKVGSARNYTMSYDTDTYAAMWVAYPLYSATMGSLDRPKNWSYNGHIDEDYQVNVTTKSYGINWTESYGNELYARGHQIPNADRNKESNWQDQTFLVTNSTPQIQNKFNASIWGSLEEAVRNAARATDTVYVATGPVFRTVGGSETIQYIHPQLDPNKNVPVPNYYWKALLKVKRSGNTVTDAYAIGFWYEHKSYVNGESYDDDEFVVSIDDIERWTGLDLFTNLPGTNSTGTEKTAEEKDNWNAFCRF